MQHKDTNLSQRPDSLKVQNDSTVPSENKPSRNFNPGEIREGAENLSTQKTSGVDHTIMPGQNADQQLAPKGKPSNDQNHDRSPISNQNEDRAWSENEKATDEETLYVKTRDPMPADRLSNEGGPEQEGEDEDVE